MSKKSPPPQFCTCPDRHEPKLVCGYPMPCPFHTALIVIDSKSKRKNKKAKRES